MRHFGLWGRSRGASSRRLRGLRWLKAGVGPTIVALLLPIAFAHAETCAQQAAAKTAELRKQIDQLLRTPDDGGSFHALGKCTIKALKLGLTLAAPGPTSDRMAKAVETADCLRLKIEQLDTMCYCAQLGADIEQDLDGEELAGRMDDSDAAYDRMQKAADKDLKKGIRNPVIQKYVESANKYKSCYDKRSLALLDGITASIDAIELAGGDGASGDGLPAVPSPSVNAPTVSPPTVGAPTASANAPTVNTPRPAAASPGVSTPAPTVNIATAAPAAAPSTSSPPAGNCTDLRNDIAAMDAQSNAMAGYIGMRVQLASLYNSLCGSSPAQRAQYWYSADGKQLGPVSAGGRPAGAAYAATADIGAQCAGTANPSMCALAAGAFGNCQTPPSDLQPSCPVQGGYGDPSDTVAATGGDPLPDAQLTVGGKTYDVSDSCAQALARISDGNTSNVPLNACSGSLLDALAQAAGAARSALAAAVGPLLQRGFAPPGASPQGGFSSAFCGQMENNAQVCKMRRDNMATCVPAANDPTKCAPQDNSGATSGQAGAFNDCYKLYSRFAGMCRMNVNQRPQIAAASLPKSVQPAAKPAPPPKPNPNAPQASSAPPPKPAPPAMSPQCQQLVSNYVAASQANDGPKALAGYNSLKQAGGCGVLAKVDKPMPAAGAPSAEDPRFAARGATSLSDQVIGGCDASPDVCAARVQQLRAGVSPEAVAALWTHAIGVGLELGGAMANAAALAAQGAPTVSGPNTNMNSIGNRPVRRTYGQGSPVGPPPVTRYGDGLHEGTAR